MHHRTIFYFFWWLQEVHQHIVFEDAYISFLTDNIKLSLAVLHSFMPLSLVNAPIAPKHLSITLSFVLKKIAFIEVARTPVKLAIAWLEVFHISPNIFISFRIGPEAFTISLTMAKWSFKGASRLLPDILSLPLWLAVWITPHVLVAIVKNLSSLPMLQKVIKMPLVFWVSSFEHTIAIDDSKAPLARIWHIFGY